MKPRKYYQFIAKDHITSKLWIVFHSIVFILIYFASVIGAEAFCDIFDIFNYRCILYSKASTEFRDVFYKNQSDSNDTINHSKFNISNAEKLPGVEDIYILDEELWLDNDTLTGRAHVGMTTTLFESPQMCNFVVFVPFMSLIIGTFFGLIVLLFSRTTHISHDSVPASSLCVLPLVVAASIMTVFTLLAFHILYNGTNKFCYSFKHLTGKTECSPIMDYFTKEQKLGYRHLYNHIYVSKRAYLINAFLWIIQLIIASARIYLAVDFTFTSVLIKSKHTWEENQDSEDAFSVHWDMGPVPQLAEVVEKIKKGASSKSS